MKWNELFSNTFKALRPQPSDIRHQVDFMLPSMPMVEACRADCLEGFEPFVANGKLTAEQVHRACERYYLGKTKGGQPIFWMIDDMLQPLDAHIGGTWISTLLKAREPLLDCWQVQHCLFGLHLMMEDAGTAPVCICVVEREETAVVMSELFPESVWMAYATTAHLVPELFAPLEGRVVTIYPRTDPTMSTYLFFLDYADLVCKSYDIELHVDWTLEDYATEDQKQRCIDILDFIKEPLYDPNSAIIPLE